MIFITKEGDLNYNSKITSIYFYSSWMPFHKKMLIMIDKILVKHTKIKFFAVDVDHFKGLCSRFNIVSIPTVIIMVDDIECKRIEGLVMTSAFKKTYNDICNQHLIESEK